MCDGHVKKDYDGTEESERKLLLEGKYGLNKKLFKYTKIKYIYFERINKKYMIDYGTIVGKYPGSSQYIINLSCGGRISGVYASHIRII